MTSPAKRMRKPWSVGDSCWVKGKIIHIWENDMFRLLIDGDQIDLGKELLHRSRPPSRKKRREK